MTFNMDTIWTTAGRRHDRHAARLLGAQPADHGHRRPRADQAPARSGRRRRPGQRQVEDNLGRVNRTVVALAVALFFFILIANWLELVPSELNEHLHLLPAPTADTNLTYAMALVVIVGVWIFGIRSTGCEGYFKPLRRSRYPVLLPLNILEELIKPITLALRLFGNIFAGGIMLALIGSLTAWTVGLRPGRRRALDRLRHHLEAVRHVHRRSSRPSSSPC